jgi:hypothetical protein
MSYISFHNVKKNEEFIFYVALLTSGDDDEIKDTPTIAAGDVRASTDGAAFGNLATLPSVDPAADRAVKVTLSATEMNGDNVIVTFEDQTPTEEWQALVVTIHTKAVDIDDLVRSTTPANTLDVSATGEAGVDWGNVGSATSTVALTNTTCGTVTTLTGHTAQTGDNYARLGAPVGADISADIASVQTDTTAIVADTNELQTDWVNAGRLDALLDAVVADVAELNDTKIPDTISLAAFNAEMDAVLDTAIPGVPTADSMNERMRSLDLLLESGGSGDAAAIRADTNELQGDWTNTGRLDTILDAILPDTGTDGVKIDFAQSYTEGQTARTIGGALELSEATERNKITLSGGTRTLFESDGATPLVARTQTSTQLG